MFTGIIEVVGKISGINKTGGKWDFSILTGPIHLKIELGDSVAIDGVCLTATHITKDGFRADASLETLNVTTLKDKKVGESVNIERAMRADGRFGGHMVMGHVDGIGTIYDMKPAGDSIRIEVEVPEELSRYVVRKGSVAIDGISLTVNEQHVNMFTVNIIPFTVSKTTLRVKKPRDRVNIETDIVGRYIERFMENRKSGGVDLRFLYEHGYIKGE